MKDEIISQLALMTGKATTQKEWLRSAEVMEMLKHFYRYTTEP